MVKPIFYIKIVSYLINFEIELIFMNGIEYFYDYFSGHVDTKEHS